MIVAVVVGGAYGLNRAQHDDPRGADRTPSASPTPLPTNSSSPTPTPSPSPTPSPVPTKTAKPLPRVAASAPKRMVVSGVFDLGFDSTTEPKDGVLTPRSTAEVARWGGRGVPGSPSRDTVFIVGKVSAGGAFERLPQLRPGTQVLLRTGSGRLTYTVREVTERRATGLTRDLGFARRVPGRLQLVGIRYDSRGERTRRVLVVTAELTGARAAS